MRKRLIDIIAAEEERTNVHPFWLELFSIAILVGIISIVGCIFHYSFGKI